MASLLIAWSACQAAPRQAAQHFACNAGYTQSECRIQAGVLRNALEKYAVSALGEWTWVLVRSNDWKRLLSDRSLSSDIPAFTYLPNRETFFDEALVKAESSRGLELSASWHMKISDLFDLAIRHEIGHALCGERDEVAAARIAGLLQTGRPVSCTATAANSRPAGARKP